MGGFESMEDIYLSIYDMEIKELRTQLIDLQNRLFHLKKQVDKMRNDNMEMREIESRTYRNIEHILFEDERGFGVLIINDMGIPEFSGPYKTLEEAKSIYDDLLM